MVCEKRIFDRIFLSKMSSQTLEIAEIQETARVNVSRSVYTFEKENIGDVDAAWPPRL